MTYEEDDEEVERHTSSAASGAVSLFIREPQIVTGSLHGTPTRHRVRNENTRALNKVNNPLSLSFIVI